MFTLFVEGCRDGVIEAANAVRMRSERGTMADCAGTADSVSTTNRSKRSKTLKSRFPYQFC